MYLLWLSTHYIWLFVLLGGVGGELFPPYLPLSPMVSPPSTSMVTNTWLPYHRVEREQSGNITMKIASTVINEITLC